MRVAQILFMVGTIAIAVCLVGAAIYMCRKYRTATGEMCLAGTVMPAGWYSENYTKIDTSDTRKKCINNPKI